MKVVTTISPGNSGGGAIHDFLLQNTDCASPVKGHEFRILQDPNGIINLYNNFYKNFTINNCSYATHNFKNYLENISKLKMRINGIEEKIYSNKLNQYSDFYLKSITKLEYTALPQFFDLKLNFLQKLMLKKNSKLHNLKKNENNFFKMMLPVEEKLFILHSKKFLNKIFYEKKKTNIILDQAVSIWDLDIAFKFFEDLKIIVITRDPRSVYYSMKSRSSNAFPGNDLGIFVKWYKDIFEKFNESYLKSKFKKKILLIKFENFIRNHNNEKKRILNFLKLKEKFNNYDYNYSKQNLLKAKLYLSKYELRLIQKNLKKFLQW